MLQYLWFASDGMGWLPLLFMAQILQGASETLFVLLLILIAKGWTICCRKISSAGRVKIAVLHGVRHHVACDPIYYHFFQTRRRRSPCTRVRGDTRSALCAYSASAGSATLSLSRSKYNSKVRFYKSLSRFVLVHLPAGDCLDRFRPRALGALSGHNAMDRTVFFCSKPRCSRCTTPTRVSTSRSLSTPPPTRRCAQGQRDAYGQSATSTRRSDGRRWTQSVLREHRVYQRRKDGAMNDFDRHELQRVA